MAEQLKEYKILEIDGVLFLVDRNGKVQPFPSSGNGGTPGNGGNGGSLPIPDFKPFELTWKQKGTSDHPRLGNQGELLASAFVIGHFCHIEAKLNFGPVGYKPGDTYLGGDDDNRFWFFQVPEILAPDFEDPKTIECAGASVHIYENVANHQDDGSCYWTKNVGSGIDGIRLSINDTDQRYHVGPTTINWNGGSHIRFSISYRRKSIEVF